VLHDFTEVKGISLKEHHLNSISKKLSALRAEAKDYLVAEGLAVPKPPLWERIMILPSGGMLMISKYFLHVTDTRWKCS